jgi:hypothetical protein
MADFPLVHAELRRLGADVGARLLRAGPLTPYLLETITEDALATGRPTLLEVSVSGDTSDRLLSTVREAFARLDARGVQVVIRRAHGGFVEPRQRVRARMPA